MLDYVIIQSIKSNLRYRKTKETREEFSDIEKISEKIVKKLTT
jgi:hypothetical protein